MPAKKGDPYFSALVVNSNPIVIIDNKDIEEVLKDEDVQQVILKHLKTDTMYELSTLNIITIDDRHNIKECTLQTKSIIKYNKQ